TLAALTLGALFVPLAACSSGGSSPAPEATSAAAKPASPPASPAPGEVPRFEYDSSFPKLPLPHEWILGEVGGVGNDPNNGHIWLIHRPWTIFGRELAAVDGSNRC